MNYWRIIIEANFLIAAGRDGWGDWSKVKRRRRRCRLNNIMLTVFV